MSDTASAPFWLGIFPGLMTSPDTAIEDIPNPQWGGVAWHHLCTKPRGDPEPRWVPSGLGAHAIASTAASGDITVRPSILCPDCGKHGWITNGVWTEA